VARFPRRARLLKPAEFERVFKNGRRETVTHFTAVAVLSDEGPRLGLAISRKHRIACPHAISSSWPSRRPRISVQPLRLRIWTSSGIASFNDGPLPRCPDPALSEGHQPLAAAALPFLSELFALRRRSPATTRFRQGRYASDPQNPALPSPEPWRVRSGA
jgi:hypothetical protein